MAEFSAAALQGRWTHSHEEDEGGHAVFRPSGWDFPPSRGRRSFELKAGGVLASGGPGPDDRTVSTGGRWSLDGDVVTLEPEGGSATRMRIVSVARDKLVVER